jgi:hypothetical protein
MVSLRALECLGGDRGSRLADQGRREAVDVPAGAVAPDRGAGAGAGRIGTADDIAAAAIMALTNGFLTGASIPVDGGEHLV